MKTLFLARHAKFDQDDESLPERERPLTARGLAEAQGMAERLARRGLQPDAVLSSPAVHARATAEVFAKRFGLGAQAVQVDERLHDASPEALLALIHGLPGSLQAVMLVGHNPGVARLAGQLSGGEVSGMPLCATAELRFDTTHWPQLGEQPAAQVRFDDRKKPRPAPSADEAEGR
ncbi:MAG: histidine phosphatase family protein [Burkholderiaceae bacterium]